MRVCFKTFGCTLNKFDTLMAERLVSGSGRYVVVDGEDEADIVVVNTCGVKKQTEDRVISYLRRLAENGRVKVVVAGCLPSINLERLVREVRADAVIGPSPGPRIIEVLDRVAAGERVFEPWSGGSSPLVPPADGERRVTEPIGICFGCLDRCAFCATRFARSTLSSVPVEDVVRHVRECLRRGVKEFYLTSPDSGAYGFDLRPRRRIIDLLRAVDAVEGDFMVRLGMINPRWVRKWLDDFIEVFAESRHLYHFLHIPVQSGSNRVLRIMRRGHTAEDYAESVERIRGELGERFAIVTDILVGHPGEGDEDFELTVKLVEETKPDYVNISKFFPRPRTPAKAMKQIPTQVTKERSRRITEVAFRVMGERNRLWLGWSGRVLINEEGKRGTVVGRNYAFRPIVFQERIELGTFVNARVVEATPIWLRGEVVP